MQHYHRIAPYIASIALVGILASTQVQAQQLSQPPVHQSISLSEIVMSKLEGAQKYFSINSGLLPELHLNGTEKTPNVYPIFVPDFADVTIAGDPRNRPTISRAVDAYILNVAYARAELRKRRNEYKSKHMLSPQGETAFNNAIDNLNYWGKPIPDGKKFIYNLKSLTKEYSAFGDFQNIRVVNDADRKVQIITAELPTRAFRRSQDMNTENSVIEYQLTRFFFRTTSIESADEAVGEQIPDEYYDTAAVLEHKNEKGEWIEDINPFAEFKKGTPPEKTKNVRSMPHAGPIYAPPSSDALIPPEHNPPQ